MPSSSDLVSAKGNESRDRLGGAEEAGGRRASVIANRPVMPFDVTCSRPTFRCFFQLPLRCQVNSQQYSGSRLEGVNIGNTASLSGFVAATTVEQQQQQQQRHHHQHHHQRMSFMPGTDEYSPVVEE